MTSVLDSIKSISPGARRFAAVDFDGRQLRVVYAERVAGATRVLKLAAVAMPEGMDIENPREVGALLAGTLKDLRLKNIGVLMNVTRAEAVLKPVTMPPGTSQDDLANMVQFQMEKELPFRPEEAVIDFTVESHYDVDAAQAEEAPSPGVEVLVGAIRLPVVDRYRRIAEAAGVKLLRLGLRPYANMRCVDACTKRGSKETVLVVHFGCEETEIDMLVGSNLSFSRSVPVKIGEAGADPHKLAQGVRTAVMEVARSVQSYEAVDRAFQIDSILIAGGTGVEETAAGELSARLGAPCELFNPTSALGLGPADNPSAFISALGLAIGHSGADQLPFDFLNPKRPREQRNWPKIAAVAAAAAVLLVVTAGVTAGVVHLGQEQAKVDKVRAEVNKEQTKQRGLKRLERRVDGIKAWREGSREWLTHWAYLSALFPSCTDAYVNNLKTFSDGSMTFTVKARESKVITDLGKRLTEAGYRFQPGRLATARDSFGYLYSSDVRVYVDDEMEVELTSVKPIPRPGDDDSVNQLIAMAHRAAAPPSGARSPNPGSSTPAAKPQPPTPSPGRGPPGRPPQGSGSSAIPGEVIQDIRQYVLSKSDHDRNGRLDSREYRTAYRTAYDYVRRKHLRLFDRNRNGRLDSSEYKPLSDLMRQMRESGGRDGRERRR